MDRLDSSFEIAAEIEDISQRLKLPVCAVVETGGSDRRVVFTIAPRAGGEVHHFAWRNGVCVHYCGPDGEAAPRKVYWEADWFISHRPSVVALFLLDESGLVDSALAQLG